MVEARVSFMQFCPFFCHFYYDQLEEYFTDEIDTLATDGKRVFINPVYIASLRPMERAFALAHEVYHCLYKDPQRGAFYKREGNLEGLPYDHQVANVAMDLRINADLIANEVGLCNPAWLYDPQIKGDEVFEDVYKKIYRPPPPGPGRGEGQGQGGSGRQGQGQGGGQGQPGQQQGQPTPGSGGNQPQQKTYGKGSRPDKTAQGNGGRFDEVQDPYIDPATGGVDLPGDMEFKEAVAKAAAAAKAMGKLPGSFQSMIDRILEPQLSWREHIRMQVTGKIGSRRETWETPNRRRLVLNPMVYMPGRKGYGAELVACFVDCSGSVSEDELATFFGEMTGILADVRPRRVLVIWCDAAVQRVEWASNLDELAAIRVKGAPGRGGTSFIPPFEYLAENDIRPDTAVYLTDMMGPFPQDPKTYPVIWCATTDIEGPFGDTVRVEVNPAPKF